MVYHFLNKIIFIAVDYIKNDVCPFLLRLLSLLYCYNFGICSVSYTVYAIQPPKTVEELSYTCRFRNAAKDSNIFILNLKKRATFQIFSSFVIRSKYKNTPLCFNRVRWNKKTCKLLCKTYSLKGMLCFISS